MLKEIASARVEVTLEIKSVSKLGKTTGDIRVDWKSSDKEGKVPLLRFQTFLISKTKALPPVNELATFNEKFTLKLKFYTEKGGALTSKRVIFTVKERVCDC